MHINNALRAASLSFLLLIATVSVAQFYPTTRGLDYYAPKGGSAGQVVTRTAGGVAWQDAAAGGAWAADDGENCVLSGQGTNTLTIAACPIIINNEYQSGTAGSITITSATQTSTVKVYRSIQGVVVVDAQNDNIADPPSGNGIVLGACSNCTLEYSITPTFPRGARLIGEATNTTTGTTWTTVTSYSTPYVTNPIEECSGCGLTITDAAGITYPELDSTVLRDFGTHVPAGTYDYRTGTLNGIYPAFPAAGVGHHWIFGVPSTTAATALPAINTLWGRETVVPYRVSAMGSILLQVSAATGGATDALGFAIYHKNAATGTAGSMVTNCEWRRINLSGGAAVWDIQPISGTCTLQPGVYDVGMITESTNVTSQWSIPSSFATIMNGESGVFRIFTTADTKGGSGAGGDFRMPTSLGAKSTSTGNVPNFLMIP